MRKFLYTVFIIAVSILRAGSGSGGTAGMAELYADRFESIGDMAYARGHVLLSYDDTVFMGDTATYDRKNNIIVLKGNVQILSERGGKVVADKIVFEVAENRIDFKNLYRVDRDDIWIYAQNAQKKDGNYTLRNSVLSSCCTDNPDWSMKFEEARYDSVTKRIALKNVKIYAKETPVFYLPYMSFSLDRERSSGFLAPHVSWDEDEGFIYEQPYFWAISDSMDLEINPQIRSDRGAGIYTTFRFADSLYSQGALRVGYFRDKDSFTDKHRLENRSHYGLEFLYESTNIFESLRPEGYREGLYANINLFNDIDYLNLQFNNFEHVKDVSRFKESRVNYFMYNDEQYFGTEAHYYIDTTREDNGDTIQELPTLQYHKFSTPILGYDMLRYTVDARLSNYYKENNSSALRGNFSLPVEFHTSFMNEFLNFSVIEEFAASDTYFTDTNLSSDHYSAAVLHHRIELSSDLIRAYSSGVHTMLLSATYTKTSVLGEGELTYGELSDSMRNDFDLDMVYDSRLSFAMHHFWEDYDGEFGIDYLALVDYYPDNDSKWNQLRQEFILKYGKLNFSTRFDYSLQDNSLVEFANSLSYKVDDYGFEINHTHREDITGGLLDQEEIAFDGYYKQTEHLTWYGGITYDIKERYNKDWKAGFLYDKKCWNMKVIFKQDITPVLKESGAGSIKNNSIFFRFNLVPIGGAGTDMRM